MRGTSHASRRPCLVFGVRRSEKRASVREKSSPYAALRFILYDLNRSMTSRAQKTEIIQNVRRGSPRMRGPAACGDAAASVPSRFAAIVRGVKASASFHFPPTLNRGSDCPGQKPKLAGRRSSRPPCSPYPSVTSVSKREPSNQSVLPMPASLMSAACVAVSLSADPADL